MKDETIFRIKAAVYAVLLLLVIGTLYTIFQTPASALEMLIRGAALFGFISLFVAIISSEYMMEVRKIFGKPFLRIHHLFGAIGLALILTHATSFAINVGSLSPFSVVLSPLETFLELAGRPALYLFIIGALAGIYRSKIKSGWRYIHLVNYVAFLFALIHGLLIGTDLTFTNPLGVIFILMGLVVVYVFISKRLKNR
ncbi:Ferric reductase domain protein transmembrane component domain protein [Methanosalsum zhilinae DSM 4017]|uniref:Ferric reductase domain protein transmembrane component domain protein n=1 Tax=Methanosalsum zhilinae (strain DSM 4017 / NBRC 107636 / OCM 62 / WeN5) TaxID=679901 RepID=F7XLR8_METZD|nr:ferric reductase [Methanosalsum zhilinae]AEH60937.1 Ferric reductase domain protein transmembrane component domain protein [Methanosalsum zhilinae DSM 4017]